MKRQSNTVQRSIKRAKNTKEISILPKPEFNVIKIDANNNCLFNSLSFYFYNDQNFYYIFKESILRFIINNLSIFANFYDIYVKEITNNCNLLHYCRALLADGYWGGFSELIVLSIILKKTLES